MIAGYPAYIDAAVRGSIARRFADFFASQAPRFDRERFLRACGL